MLDFKFVRENRELVRQNIRDRHVTADVDDVLALFDQRNELIQQVESLRSARNRNTEAMKAKPSPEERDALIAEGRSLKDKIAAKEGSLAIIEGELRASAEELPNMSHPDAPRGSSEEDNKEIEQVGTRRVFDFSPKDHVVLAEALDLVDFEAARDVSGSKFYYLKNEAVFLELALVRYAMDILQKHGFTPMITPDIARADVVQGIGFIPRGPESNIYALEDEETCLVGTAEITLGGYYRNKTLPADSLPRRMGGLSHCFRREAGSAGQFSRGLYRVHQFTKVEMFAVCTPEQSEDMHREMLTIEKEIFSGLEIPFRVLDICTGDLGGPAYRKYDLEAWMPGRGESGEWGEITSTSNCTDFQSRRLNIRYAGEERGYAHLLNGTAVAVTRAIIAILENFQQSDGSVLIPTALQRYTGFDQIRPPKDA